MKSLLPVCKRVKPFIAEKKDLVAGITLVNLIFFLFTFTDLFIFKLLFTLVFSYSNFRVLKLYTNEAPTKAFLTTQIKFFLLTVVEFATLAFGTYWVLCVLDSTLLPLLASVVLAVIISIVTVYVLLIEQAVLVALFVKGTTSYNVLHIGSLICDANRALGLYGEQHRSHMISLFTFFFTVLLLLGVAGHDSKLYLFLIVAITSFCVSVYNVCVLPLILDLDDEETTKANRKELAKVLAGECGCDGHSHDAHAKAEPGLYDSVVKVCGNIINPEFYVKFVGQALFFLLYSIPGAFQYVYSLIDDVVAGHQYCQAQRKLDKANSTNADSKAEAKDSKENEDTLEKAFNTPAVIPTGEPTNTTDTVAEDFKIKGDDEVVADTEVDNSDSLETSFNTKAVLPEGEPDNKSDSIAEDFKVAGDKEVEVKADEEDDTNPDSLEADFNTKAILPEGEPDNKTDSIAEDFQVAGDKPVTADVDAKSVDTNPDSLEKDFEAPLANANADKPENKTDTLAEEFKSVSETEVAAQAKEQAEELAVEEADKAKAEEETLDEEINESATSLESMAYPFPEYEDNKKEEKDDKADKK